MAAVRDEKAAPPRCKWCENVAEPDGGFYYEPEDDSPSKAEAGWYCSIACWLSAG